MARDILERGDFDDNAVGTALLGRTVVEEFLCTLEIVAEVTHERVILIGNVILLLLLDLHAKVPQ